VASDADGADRGDGQGGKVAERAAAAFMPTHKIDVATIEAAVREAETA